MPSEIQYPLLEQLYIYINSTNFVRKMFYDETSMSAHLSLHSGNPLLPFPCHYCHKRFKRSCKLLEV